MTVLLQHVLQLPRKQFLALDFSQYTLTDEQLQALNYYSQQRVSLCPLAYIIKKRSFWNHDFIVTPHTLDPRPETEEIVRLGLELLPQNMCNILDLGTGSGCILLSLLSARQNWYGLGVDFRQQTLQVAKHNARRLKLSRRAKFRYGNWYKPAAMPSHSKYHLCTCNAPYVASGTIKNLQASVRDYEPRAALCGGTDGLLSYHYILRNIHRYLREQGLLIMEHDHTQQQQLLDMIKHYGLRHHSSHRDYSQKNRITIAQKP